MHDGDCVMIISDVIAKLAMIALHVQGLPECCFFSLKWLGGIRFDSELRYSELVAGFCDKVFYLL